MAGYKPRRGFQEQVARRLVAPKVDQVAARVADTAKTLAPGTKQWRTVGDDRVRREHREADGQDVPDNVRFLLRTPASDRNAYPFAWQEMIAPRDPSATIGLVVECRCHLSFDPEGLARTIAAGHTVVAGTRVTGKVVATHPRAVDAEFGGDKDTGARYMGRAAEAERR